MLLCRCPLWGCAWFGARHAFPPSGPSYFWRTLATWLLEALLLSDALERLWRKEPLVALWARFTLARLRGRGR
ncbi:hypothetical protein [Fontibacillus phaseoli]|uniref:hypothetical protein n=1 Tax=Fontibacillus phaseoli TaxID=1416533 RepID=UPI0011C047D9|nr:hypothetical protein [Fontibacillus phaseoli]